MRTSKPVWIPFRAGDTRTRGKARAWTARPSVRRWVGWRPNYRIGRCSWTPKTTSGPRPFVRRPSPTWTSTKRCLRKACRLPGAASTTLSAKAWNATCSKTTKSSRVWSARKLTKTQTMKMKKKARLKDTQEWVCESELGKNKANVKDNIRLKS